MLLNDRMEVGFSILRQARTFAVVGVSQDRQKYGHEVFRALKEAGYAVFPVNPKYATVDGEPCYASLAELPEKPDVVVTAVPPAVTEEVAKSCAALGIGAVWMPPQTWSEKAVEACSANGIREVHDVCVVFALRALSEKT